jgi:CRISPR/Cas system-associated protein Cas5 (RAMP superfamily)
MRPTSRSLLRLAQDVSFWQEINETTGADLIVAASIDVKVLDRSGYTTEEYVSPQDGQTYFRQVLVEETGFSYDVLLVVIEGKSGDIVHQEQITDFKPKDERKLEEYTDMFTDLYTLQNRLIGIFVPRLVQVKRSLYKN